MTIWYGVLAYFLTGLVATHVVLLAFGSRSRTPAIVRSAVDWWFLTLWVVIPVGIVSIIINALSV